MKGASQTVSYTVLVKNGDIQARSTVYQHKFTYSSKNGQSKGKKVGGQPCPIKNQYKKVKYLGLFAYPKATILTLKIGQN